MKLVTYEHQQQVHIGMIVDDQVLDLVKGLNTLSSKQYLADDCDMRAFLELEDGLAKALELQAKVKEDPAWAKEFALPTEDVVLKAPILKPNKIICIGLNYRDHVAEGGGKLPQEPVIFGKYANAIVGPGEDILYPTGLTEKLDYEAELGVVIGRTAFDVQEDEALDYVAGYLNFNDVSARDLQMRDGQWMKGKCLDTFAPMGPWLVTNDEIPDPGVLDISLTLNGKQMQSSNTSYLIFNVPYLVSFLSKLMTLDPGDVIATGTPAGVAMAHTPPAFMVPGDVVEVKIQGLGVLSNKIATRQE